MKEIELKLLLDPSQERALRNSPRVRALGEGRPQTQTLHSIYYDTPCGALRAQRIALRLRQAGRTWVQTVKQSNGAMVNGLSTPHEIEFAVPGRALALERIRDDDLRETLIGHAREGLAPVIETRFRRTRRILCLPNGARIEMAIDIGELLAGDRAAPLAEVEFELLEGSPADLYAVAAEVFTRAPVRFAQTSKSERALALLQPDAVADAGAAGAVAGAVAAGAATGEAGAAGPRKARKLALSGDQTVERAAVAIFEEALAHFMPNLADLLQTDALSGPHQARVALRRLRSALKAFGPALGAGALAPWSDSARDIAAVAGQLRDLDVLVEELLPRAVTCGGAGGESGGNPGGASLVTAYLAHRDHVRAEVRAALSGAEVTRFAFAFAGFLAGRGWLDPADHGQTARLAQPLGPYAGRILSRRWKAVARYGARMETLSIDERHEMRKELKKFRYLLDAFRGLYDPVVTGAMMRQIKDLQAAFGALNDQAMAEAILTAPDAPAADDPVAQRAAGRLIGHLEAEAERLWPRAIADWSALQAAPRPWKQGRP